MSAIPDNWNETVAEYPSGTIFHTREWLELLQATQGAEPVIEPFEIDGHAGWHVAALIRKGPFKVLGSPIPGWTTVRMGPLFDPAVVDHAKLAASIKQFAKDNGASMIELAHELLDAEAMSAAGFDKQPDGTFVVDLPSDPEALWDVFKSTARNRVRKGRKNGLTVEIGVDEKLVDDVWEKVEAIFRHQNLVVPYDRARVQEVYDRLAPIGRVAGIRVLAPDGHVAACGIFPHDDDTIYFWAGASSAEDRALVPNELMHFEIMAHAIELGLKRYDMCGGGDYKKKFGAHHIDNPHWIHYGNPAAKLGRAAMAKAVAAKRAIAARKASGN